MQELIKGYRRFRAACGERDAARYRELASEGQNPHTVVFSCCDSRADPAIIFDAGPGEMFVVRNIANLVPPYEEGGEFHGTSAALEFGVTGLQVKRILVMGHAGCGGVGAFLDNMKKTAPKGFIAKWMTLLSPAVEALDSIPEHDRAARQRMMEEAGVRLSLANLMTFPFVAERVAAGKLTLIGGYFSVSDARLYLYDSARDGFFAVDDKS
jgi:carbonic anhydrase